MHFIDICFPKNNEISFIEVAQKIKTKELIFVYEKKDFEIQKKHNSENKENNFKSQDAKNNSIIIKKFCLGKDIFVFNENIKKQKNKLCFIDSKHNNFRLPDRLTQVYVKTLKENNLSIIISPKILKNNSYELGKYVLFVNLCKKYKVNLFISSLAENPYELKEKRLLFAFMNFITKDTAFSKKTLTLYN
ncbi:MAG: hypothetical protein QW757_01385 [Candidatus Woesearchaeota archaeon]